MPFNGEPNFNDFCSGHIVVNENRNMLYCNEFIANLSATPIDQLINSSISQCFSKASNIFIDSYVYPLLLVESSAQEIQLSWVNINKQVVPVIVNIKVDEAGNSYWSVYECTTRDKLQTELIKAKDKLELQSKELYQLAITDPLTGLMNRRELENQANRVIHQADRNLSTFALLNIDVDFFKHVNDSYGHQAGDKVLIQLAKLFKEGRRVNDIVARLGGEEFVIVLPDIDRENAYLVAENLRKSIEATQIENINITISMGIVVSRSDEVIDFGTLLNLSDKALYMSKNNGRNKTTVADY